MARYAVLARRSRGDWTVRALLVVATLGLAYVSMIDTIAYSIRGKAVEQAHRLAPGNGAITSSLSEKLSGPDAGTAERREADRIARLALRQDPTVVAAVATLGINAQIRNDTATARRLFAYSEALSRRDLRTQLWAIEDAVARGDVRRALEQYDIALRTSRFAPDLLFPVLAAAIADTAVRKSLVDTMARKPPWAGLFVEYAGASGLAPLATADLFRALRPRGIAVSDRAATSVINALISAGRMDDAWGFYTSVRPGAERARSRDPQFLFVSETPSPFDWRPNEDAAITTSFQRGERGGLLDFAAPSMVGGVAVRQIQLLPAGRYVLDGHSVGIDLPEDSRPYWVLSCRDGAEIGRFTVPPSAQTGGRFSAQFTVPVGCPVQELALVVRAADDASGAAGQFDRVALRPVR